MNRDHLLSFLFIVLTIPNLTGQRVFVPGYYINLEEDTIKGEILQADLKSRFDDFVFRNGSKTETIDHEKAITFSYDQGRKFTAAIVENTYTEVLVEGVLSLYQRGDLFYFKKNDRIYLINTTPINVEDNNSLIQTIDPQWKNIITALTADCKTSYLEEITLLVPNTKNFITAVEEYNQCYALSSTLYTKSNEWARFKYGATFGQRHSRLRFSNRSRLEEYVQEQYHADNLFSGLSLHLHSPRLNRRFGLQLDFLYYEQRFYSSNIISNEGIMRDNQVVIDTRRYEFPMYFTYQVNKGFVSNFLQLGISTDFVSQDIRYITDEIQQNQITTSQIRDPWVINKWQNSIIAGTSLVFDFKIVELSADIKIRLGDRFNKTGFFNSFDRDLLYGITLYYKNYE
ncbi:hypothetical protein [Portibacter marinus]|uniref:hypothetical protein n=1 Tax=Portibacter marinus TaxID=2898660 RepID=UPI001F17A789|nr:hypothetical protein [Portibacter marinus]